MSRFLAVLGFLCCPSIDSAFTDDSDFIGSSKLKIYDYLRMISEIQDYHKTSSVFMIYANDQSLETSTLILLLTREFSSKLVFSLALNYTDVTDHRPYYQSHMVKPLCVSFLNTLSELDLFQKMTRSYEISYSIWLVIFDVSLKRACEQPGDNGFRLGFDTELLVKCDDDPKIVEWYALDRNELSTNELASWDPGRGLRVSGPKELYERRNNLRGKTLRVATVKESPFIMEHEGQMSGFFAKILKELSDTLNFSAPTTYSEDIYGSFDEKTNSWTGVIGRLMRNEVDLGIAEFSMTGRRLDAVDFTYPVMLSQNNIYMRQPDSSALQWSGYFRVYTWDIWVAIEVVYLVSVLLITYMKIKIKEKPCETSDHVFENSLGIWGLFSFQALPDFPKASALRIAYFSLLVNAFVVVSVYSACLISYLSVTSPGLPFKSLTEFAEDDSYKMIALQESSDYDLFSRSNDATLVKLMKQMVPPEHLPKTMVDGFKRACENKIAFYTSEAVKMQISAGIPCHVAFIKSGRIDSLAITLMKKSQYTGIINYQLQKFKSVGIMQRLKSTAYTKIPPSDNKFNPLNVRGIVTILSVLGVGMMLSVAILIFEIAMNHRAMGYRRTISDSTPTTKSLAFT